MNENLATFLGLSIAVIALFSFLSVAAWSGARQREREAYYKNEAIKKVAEMQGNAPESVLQLLREALAPRRESLSPWINQREQRREREAYYRSETLKKIAEMQGAGADTMLAMMREEEARTARRVREGMKLAGLITAGVGIGVIGFLSQLVPDQPVFLVGLIPFFIGAALLAYVYLFGPKE